MTCDINKVKVASCREVVNNAKRLVGSDNCHLALDVIKYDKQVQIHIFRANPIYKCLVSPVTLDKI